MKFFLDHDVPDEVGQSLDYWGHNVTRLRDVLAVDTADAEVFAYAERIKSVIITCNRIIILRWLKRDWLRKNRYQGWLFLSGEKRGNRSVLTFWL